MAAGMMEQAPGSQVELFKLRDMGESIGTMAIPVRDHLSAATTSSLLMTDLSWIPPEKSIYRTLIQGGILTLQRNEAVQRMEGDWLIFIDDDMVWQPDAIKQLVQAREEHDLDILGGLCFRRSSPFQPTLYMREAPDAGAYNFLERWDSDIVEVDATGMAFVIIHKRVFEKIAGSPMPSLEERIKLGPSNFFKWDGILGEDLRFCQDARRAGCKVFVDTRIEIGHAAEIIVSKKNFLQELALRPDDLLAERRKVNTAMGFPTVTREEAMEELGL
jgi:Predicted glycosyltransferases